jgi:hypothetical protein
MYLSKLINAAFLAASAVAHLVVPNDDQDMSGVVVNGIPYSTRVKYMRLVLLPTPLSVLSSQNINRQTRLSSSKAVPVLSLPMEPSS